MTWLDEIEKTNKKSREYHELNERNKIPEYTTERMARVIRELVGVARMGQGLIWLIDALGGAKRLDEIGPDRKRLAELLDNLPPDAKELIYDKKIP